VRTLVPALALLVFLASGLPACGGSGSSSPPGRVRLATTTSTENSGLLDHLLPPFEEATGLRVDVIAVGTGQALANAERGDADLVLVHSREREDAFVAAGHGIDRRDVMWNDFVIVGPRHDPAGIGDTADAAQALSQIAVSGNVFVSRGDDSGTHIRELSLWKTMGERQDWDGYLEAGQGMGPCLVIAHEKGGYTLTDRGTYLAFRDRLQLAVHVEGDARLRNPYGVIRVNPERHEHVNADGARRLIDYLTSAEGQARIGGFRVDGEVLFHPARGR